MRLKNAFQRIRTIMILFILLSGTHYQMHAQQLKLSFKDTPLKSVLDEISNQTGYNFVYSEYMVNSQKTVTILYEKTPEEPLNLVLDKIFNGTNIIYKITGKQVALTLKSIDGKVKSQRVTYIIKGVVTDDGGETIPGVAVKNKTTGKIVAADLDGKYQIEAQEGDNILFSSIGMADKTITLIGKKEVLDIALHPDAIALEDVIVTGYQTLSKERSAGSYKIVKGSDVSDRASFNGSLISSLEGVSTGLSMTGNNESKKVLMRGVNSVNSNQSVLYVLDGVAIEAENVENMVNSNDIANITFLKDATAASIWGARAANGVIVLTTKSGSNSGKKIEISYDGSFKYDGLPNHDYYNYMSPDKFIRNTQEIFNGTEYPFSSVTSTTNGFADNVVPVVFPHEMVMYNYIRTGDQQTYEKELARLSAVNNRAQIEKYLMAKALQTNHSLAFTGGSDFHKYYGSFMYNYNQANNRDKSNKYVLNLRQDFNFTKWLKLDVTFNLMMNDNNMATQPSEGNFQSMVPYMMLLGDNGEYLSHSDIYFYAPEREKMELQSGINLNYLPMEDINSNSFKKIRDLNARINAGMNIKLHKSLTFDTRFQYQRNTQRAETFSAQQMYSVRKQRVNFTSYPTKEGEQGVQHLPSSGGIFENGSANKNEWTFRNQLLYNHDFNNKHQLTALAGFEVRGLKTNAYMNKNYGYNPQTMTYTPFNTKDLETFGVINPILRLQPSKTVNYLSSSGLFKANEIETRYVSFYANAAYTYLSKYTVNASVRVDQSNLFGTSPDIQFKPLWALGASWNLSKENFLKEAKFINNLNLRGSYGLGGNCPNVGDGGPYNLLTSKSNAKYPGIGYIIKSPANDNLVWEKTQTFNIGVDFALLNNKLSGSFEYYNRRTTDLLSSSKVDPTTGWQTAYVNAGSLYNKGVEILLESVNISTKKFQWRTTLTISHNKNKVTSIYNQTGYTALNLPSQDFVEGYPAYAIFAYKWAGLDQMGDPQVYNGEEKVKKNTQIKEMESVEYLGSSQPKWYGAFMNTLSFYNFDLSFKLIYNFGSKIRNDVNNFYSGRIGTNLKADFDNRWRNPGDELTTNVPSYIANTNADTQRRSAGLLYANSNINVLDGGYVKLRDIIISYSLPKNICNKLMAENIRIKCQLGNLFTIACNKEGIDPEAISMTAGGKVTRTAQFGPSYSVGLSIKFK